MVNLQLKFCVWMPLAKIHNDLDLKINSLFCNDGNWLKKYSPQSSLQGIFWSNCRVNPIPKSSRCVKTLISPRVIWKYHMMWKEWRSTCHTLMLTVPLYGSLKGLFQGNCLRNFSSFLSWEQGETATSANHILAI